MWSATGFSSGTPIIYFVYTASQHRRLSFRPLIPIFADDSQLHNSSVHLKFPPLACSVNDYISDIKLKMSDDKNELSAISSMSKISQVILNLAPLSCSSYDMPLSQSDKKNLHFFLDETLSMDAHVKHPCRILFYHLHRSEKNPPLPIH